MFTEILPQIFTGIASIAALWFTYNQYTKNKITDYKIEKWKKQEEERGIKNAGNIATIYGELWELLYFLKADRVYLIQPHPLYKEMYISATLEVRQYGVSSVKDAMNGLRIETVPKFSSLLANNDYLFIDSVKDYDFTDKTKSILQGNGCYSLALRKLVDESDRWIGTIVVGYTHKIDTTTIDKELVEKMTRSSALAILYILPEYKTIE